MTLAPRTIAPWVAVLVLEILTPSSTRGEAAADPLLRLVPADAALTIVVEDLRGRAREIAGSPLANAPAVRDLLASARSLGFREALKKVESNLGVDLSTIRDDLFGEAVVLSLRLPPGGRPEDARGLLLLRVPDKAALDRMVGGLNAAHLKSGRLLRIVDRVRAGTSYHVREFVPGRGAPESYASLNDRVFAWSNSEELILGAIDHQSGATAGLAGVPEFQRTRERLPRGALGSLYVDPRFVERLVAASSKPQNPVEEKLFAGFARYLAAIRYAGAALEWRDGLIFHTEEVVDPSALDLGLKRWATRGDAPEPSSRRVPPSTLLMATANVDFGAVVDGLMALASDQESSKIDNMRVALNGLLMGLDGRAEVLSRLGPRGLFYVEGPSGNELSKSGSLPAVVSIELARDPAGAKAVAAIENALRTVLAIYALDDKHGGGRLRVKSQTSGATTITSLSESTPFAFAIYDGRLVVGTSAEAVARSLQAATDPRASDRVERVRSAYFPDSVSFAMADLRAIHDLADRHRADLTRYLAARPHAPDQDATHDLDRALALIGLFDAAFFTTTVAPDFTAVHHAFGLVRLAAARPPVERPDKVGQPPDHQTTRRLR